MTALGTKARILLERHEVGTESFSFDLKGKRKGTLVLFMCNHCPFVLHVIEEVVMIANDYRVQGLGVIAISVTM
jgi:hypothetical protein